MVQIITSILSDDCHSYHYHDCCYYYYSTEAAAIGKFDWSAVVDGKLEAETFKAFLPENIVTETIEGIGSILSYTQDTGPVRIDFTGPDMSLTDLEVSGSVGVTYELKVNIVSVGEGVTLLSTYGGAESNQYGMEVKVVGTEVVAQFTTAASLSWVARAPLFDLDTWVDLGVTWSATFGIQITTGTAKSIKVIGGSTVPIDLGRPALEWAGPTINLGGSISVGASLKVGIVIVRAEQNIGKYCSA